MHRIYNYIPETNHVSNAQNVAAIYSEVVTIYGTCSVLPYVECFCLYNTTSRSMCAEPKMAVFCTSLISCFPHMFLRYFLYDCTTIPVSLIITGTTFVITFYMRSISIVRPSYCEIFSAFLNYVSIS